MKQRFRIVGVCLVAVFALSAVVVAGSAQAGQMGSCEKATKVVKKYTGEYTDKLCTTRATEGQITEGTQNKYTWHPTPPVPFLSQGGVFRIKGNAGEIVCKYSKDSGEILAGGRGSKDTLEFVECTLKPFELQCNTLGQPSGTLISYPIRNYFLGLGHVLVGFTNAGTSTDPVFGSGPWVISFQCGGIPFAVSGSVSGVVPEQYVATKLKAGSSASSRKGYWPRASRRSRRSSAPKRANRP